MTTVASAAAGAATAADGGLPVLRSRLLGEVPGVVHGVSRRVPGLGLADGNTSYSAPRDVADAWAMRQRWGGTIGVDPERLAVAGQVHGDAVLRIGAADAGRGARPGSGRVGLGDALMTDEPGVVLLSHHADCLPLLLVDPERPAVAVVHAGWRGTVADVAGAAVLAMAAAYGSRPGELRAFLGPAIGPCCYEVGAEVAAAWGGLVGGEAGGALTVAPASGGGSGPTGERWWFDLPEANALLLARAGLGEGQVERSGICTRCGGEDWFSHRGQGAGTGRFAAVIALSERG